MPDLEGLWIKWSAMSTVEKVHRLKTLRYLHLGNASRLESLEPLTRIPDLKWLGLGHIKKIRDLNVLGQLTQLEGLTVAGSVYSTQTVRSLAPLHLLQELRFLSLVNLRAENLGLQPLLGLNKLEDLIIAYWWAKEEVDALCLANPRLVVNGGHWRYRM